MKNYFYFSLSLHILLFCCFLSLQINPEHFTRIQESVLTSYFISDFKTENSKVLFHKDKLAVFKNKKTEASSISRNQNKLESQQAKKTDNNALLQLLHEAIFEKQSYPQEAILMHETGTVTISMMVHPDGEVDQVALLKSSGYPMIDTAAEKAVKEISPISGVKKYLTKEKVFSIEVNFE